MKNQNSNVDPAVIKKWIAIVIAVLSAIAGAIGESQTDLVSNFIHFIN